MKPAGLTIKRKKREETGPSTFSFLSSLDRGPGRPEETKKKEKERSGRPVQRSRKGKKGQTRPQDTFPSLFLHVGRFIIGFAGRHQEEKERKGGWAGRPSGLLCPWAR